MKGAASGLSVFGQQRSQRICRTNLMRYVQTRYLWVLERIREGHVKILPVRRKNNPADLFAKAVNQKLREKILKILGFVHIRASEECGRKRASDPNTSCVQRNSTLQATTTTQLVHDTKQHLHKFCGLSRCHRGHRDTRVSPSKKPTVHPCSQKEEEAVGGASHEPHHCAHHRRE